jgi:glycosyltransferase involved in cell wall biosynthesis
MAVRLSRKLKTTGVLWYHNHDKELRNSNRPFSVGWWAYETERRAFRRIDFFSVPARERLALFPVDKLRNPPAVLPNYPSWRRIGRQSPRKSEEEIRLVYQGSLGRHHGFDEIVQWLGREICGKRLSLTLIGKIDDGYRSELVKLAEHCGVTEWFEIRSFVPFTDLPGVLAGFDIGLAIHEPVGVTYSTGGTASNKIYEYAAAGLPVMLYDSPHYREYLGQYEWTAFSSLTWVEFARGVEQLMENLEQRSSRAMDDIRTSLNYEAGFEVVWSRLALLLETSLVNAH